MKYRAIPFAFALCLLAALTVPALAQDGAMAFHPVTGAEIEFNPIEVPGFDSGMQIAAIHGDPAAAGGAYVIRLSFPDGYRFPPHFHPMAENVTVLSGTFLLAMGEEADESELDTYRPGDYLFIDAEHPHFGGARGETVIQLHGTGPFDIIVVGSEQDRR